MKKYLLNTGLKNYFQSFILVFTMLLSVGVLGQTTLANFKFESNLNPESGAIGSPTLITSTSPNFANTYPSGVTGNSAASTTNNSYLELTISTAGYTSITVSWAGRTSNVTAPAGNWILYGDSGSGYGLGLYTQTLTTSFVNTGNISLSTAFNNNSTVKLKIINSNNGSARNLRLDDLIISGTAAASSYSGVSTGAGAEPATISSLINTQAAASLNFDFIVTDDANVAAGNDSLPTLVSQIILPQGTGNDITDWTQAIAGAELSDGTTSLLGTVNATNITFSGINTATLGNIADGANKTYTLKVWLKTALGGTLPTTIDGLNLAFKIDRTNFTTATSATSTQFESGAGTAVESGSTNNAVVVIATKLAYPQQPSTTATNVAMTPAVTVSANDANANRDLNYTSSVSVASTGTLTGNPVSVSASAGLATFSSLTHTAVGTGLKLTASSGSFASLDSNTFDITLVTTSTDYFQSRGTGNWSTPGSWQSSSDNVTWMTATISPTSSAASIKILNGHTITVAASATAKLLTVDAGGILVVNSSFSLAGNTNINGTWNQSVGTAISNSGTLNFNANSIYNHNPNGGTIPTATWNVASTCNIKGMTSITPSGLGQAFGIVNWNCPSQSAYSIMGANGAFNPKGLFTVVSTGSNVIELESGGSGSTYNFDGGLTVSGGKFDVNFDGSGAAKEVALNVNGDLTISGSGVIDMHDGNSNPTTSGYGSTIYLTGNLNISSSAAYPLTATGNSNAGYMFFVGTTPQSYTTTISNPSNYVDFEVSGTSTLNLLSDLPLFSSSTSLYDEFFVSGILNLGTYAIKQSSGSNAKFTTFSGSTVTTSNTGGLVSAIVVGGIKTFAAGTNYAFNANTTTPFPTSGTFGNPGSLTFNNANVTSNRTIALTVSGAVNVNGTSIFALNSSGTNNLALGGAMTIASGATFDNGGENQITNGGGSILVNGTFITKDIDGFTGTNTSIPSITPTLGTNSTVVYGLTGNQTVTDFAYKNLTFSGSGIKTTPTINSIAGTVTIKDLNTVVDTFSSTIYHNFGDSTTNLLMQDASKLIVGTGGIQPKMGGTYTLADASTIEFAGSSVMDIRVTPQYANVIVSGEKVTVGGKNFVVNQVLKVTGATAVLTIPDTPDSDTPYVVTAKKGIQMLSGGKAIFKNNANLLQDNSVSNTGSIIAQRIAKLKFESIAKADYNYWSSPVKDQKLLYNSGTAGASFSPGTPNNRIFDYKQSNDTFVGTADPNFVAGKGYAIRAESGANGGSTADGTAKTFEFLGEPNNGDVSSPSLAYTNAAHGYNLVGNPYPSIIDFNLLHAANSDLIDNTAYFWTNVIYTPSQQGGSSAGYTGSNYATFNGTGGAPAAGSLLEPTKYIKTGQGFIVQTKKAGKLNFTNAMRQIGASPFFNNKLDEEKNRFWITLSTPSDMTNTILIGYVEGATNGFEKDYDAPLLVNGSDSFYSILGSEKLVIQGKNNSFTDEDVISVGAKYYENGLHKIQLTKKEGIFNGSQDVYLRDKLLNKVVNLSNGDYTFQAVKGTDVTRFEVLYKDDAVLGTDSASKSDFVIYRDGTEYVINSSKNIGRIEVYDATGRLVISQATSGKNVRLDVATLINGIYIIKAENSGDVKTKKIIK